MLAADRRNEEKCSTGEVKNIPLGDYGKRECGEVICGIDVVRNAERIMELVRVDNKDIDMNGQRYMRTDRRVPILYSRNMLVVQNDVAKLQSRRWY